MASSSSRPRADPTAPVPHARTAIEYRKDGAVSKMRSHKGNIPVLPQTKLCPHCPAKFTRTTHLNRHLRTHTGDRSHRCDTCDAQFTRSDLLTRHKKTCADSSHTNRTRRRSCQACADSKVRCDLQRPCSKCQARGKECVFVIRSTKTPGTGTVATVERTSASEGSAPVPISTTRRPSSSPTRPYVSADHLPIDERTVEGWAIAPSAASSDGTSARSSSDCFHCSGDTGSPAVPQPSFSTLFSGELLEPFIVYPSYNSPSVSADHSRSPNVSTVSPTSAVGDPSFTTQGVLESQHPFQPSGESVYYAPSSVEQVQDVISNEHVGFRRQRYVQDYFVPSFSGPIDQFKQENLTEEHHYVYDSSVTHGRSRVRSAGPYQAYAAGRRAPREGQIGGLLPHAFVDPFDGEYYGRHCEKLSRVSGSVLAGHHWMSLENDVYDALHHNNWIVTR